MQLFPGARVVEKRSHEMHCRFTPNGSTTSVSFKSAGGVSSVARAATGKFTVTLSEKKYRAVCAVANFNIGNTATAIRAVVGTISGLRIDGSTASQTSITVWLLDAAGAATDSSDTARFVDLKLTFDQSAHRGQYG
jgi:hypothetical protein